MSDYSCEREDLFDRLLEFDFFKPFVVHQYVDVYFGYGTHLPRLSDYNLSEAHQQYVKDASRVSGHEFAGKPLDHFKRAALLCYWLRRTRPIYEFVHSPDYDFAQVRLRADPKKKIRYANQGAAFDLGFRICCFWESYRLDSEKIYGRKLKPTDFSIDQQKEFSHDLAYILADKNMSPHALALIYRALFVQVLKATR